MAYRVGEEVLVAPRSESCTLLTGAERKIRSCQSVLVPAARIESRTACGNGVNAVLEPWPYSLA